jgi:hypothetical protein
VSIYRYEKHQSLPVASFLRSFPITHWFTLTTSEPRPIFHMQSAFNEWMDGMQWLNKAPIGWFWCAETQPWLHFHGGLISPSLNTSMAEHLWRDIAHGDGQIERYDPARGAIPYSFKESYRSGEWDLDNLDYYSVHGRRRRPALARSYFNAVVADAHVRPGARA